MKRELDYVYFIDKFKDVAVKREYWEDVNWKYPLNLSKNRYVWVNGAGWRELFNEETGEVFLQVKEEDVPIEILTYHLLTY